MTISQKIDRGLTANQQRREDIMAENKYRVLITGELKEGASADEVRSRLARLFKTTTEKIDGLLKRSNVVIKKNTDLETAKKYVRAIESAGAACRIEPPASSAEAPAEAVAEENRQASTAEAEEPTESTEPRVVPIHLINKEEDRFSPQTVEKIAGSSNGLNLNLPELSDIPYNQINALTAYSVAETNSLMLFIHSQTQPLACQIENIAYPDFPIKQLAKPIASFRNFLYFLCRKNPNLFLEETTFDFLSGNQLQALDETKVEKLATNMGRLIESGEMAAQA